MNIEETCMKIATCGPLGTMRLAGLGASLLALPIFIGFKTLFWIDYQAASIILATSIIALFVIMSIALHAPSYQPTQPIVIDRTIGMSLALMLVPWSIRLIAAGFTLFYLLRYLIPIIVQYGWKLETSHLPSIVALTWASLTSGILVQIILRMVVWFGNF